MKKTFNFFVSIIFVIVGSLAWAQEKGTTQYDDGSVYTGQFFDGVPVG